MKPILASTSRIRRQILSNAGVDFTVMRPNVDESELKRVNPDWTSVQTAEKLSFQKALAISFEHTDRIVIGADQTLSLHGKTFDKPSDMILAREQLSQLKGQTHQLISAVCCVRDNRLIWSHTAVANLTMRDFSDAFLTNYLQRMGIDCLTSVGAYKIEGIGLQMFERIEGDYFSILGLPLLPLLGFLRDEKVLNA